MEKRPRESRSLAWAKVFSCSGQHNDSRIAHASLESWSELGHQNLARARWWGFFSEVMGNGLALMKDMLCYCFLWSQVDSFSCNSTIQWYSAILWTWLDFGWTPLNLYISVLNISLYLIMYHLIKKVVKQSLKILSEKFLLKISIIECSLF